MINITNNLILDPNITSVKFHQLDLTLTFATKIASVIAIWETDPLDGGEDLLAWKAAIFSAYKPENSDVYIFISNSSSSTSTDVWNGPYRNFDTALTSFTERYLKIRIVLIQKGELKYQYNYNVNPVGPYVDYLLVKCIVSGTSSKFFTKAFDIGFSPRYVALTAESDIPDGSIVRYGITNIDSTNLDYYQFVDNDKITKLIRLPVTGQKVKLYIEMSGNSGDPITIHEFAVMFSGNTQIPLNE